jgi:excisionase family DNA binding protein
MVSIAQPSTVVLNNLFSVKAAGDLSGYSLQYLRRLLRNGKLIGLKVGQLWLIELAAFEAYLESVSKVGPHVVVGCCTSFSWCNFAHKCLGFI